VYVEILKDQSATAASGFFKCLIDHALFTITKVLADNGKEFTDRFRATGPRQPTGTHAFDRVCADHHMRSTGKGGSVSAERSAPPLL